jgi:hypothetical protein
VPDGTAALRRKEPQNSGCSFTIQWELTKASRHESASGATLPFDEGEHARSNGGGVQPCVDERGMLGRTRQPENMGKRKPDRMVRSSMLPCFHASFHAFHAFFRDSPRTIPPEMEERVA